MSLVQQKYARVQMRGSRRSIGLMLSVVALPLSSVHAAQQDLAAMLQQGGLASERPHRQHEGVRFDQSVSTIDTAEFVPAEVGEHGWEEEFWRSHQDRLFMMKLYPKLGSFSRVLDVGVKPFSKRCKALIASPSTAYYQLEPYPPAKTVNDGFLHCTMQESVIRYPQFKGFFDAIVDFGVLGWGGVKLSSADIRLYVQNVRELLQPKGMYALKVDRTGAQRLNFTTDIDPYFDHVDFRGFKSGLEFQEDCGKSTRNSLSSNGGQSNGNGNGCSWRNWYRIYFLQKK